ncbi:Y-family DNA polymerase [Variovorax sp. PvP013]|uniref:Y-family DNA polymerase n=1 Tax=Variovorax sp. PvP013 TaxID=3156435 RepID=UPI003D218E36
MQWIALRWQPEAEIEAEVGAPPSPVLSTEALGWWALQFTPRVAWLDEALVLEVSACERLWGGQRQLLRQMDALNPVPLHRLRKVLGATAPVALARLRLFAAGRQPPADIPAALPLHTLTAARDRLDLLARMGCTTWGDVAALPRAGLSRRFGPALREALDVAWGLRPERHAWLTLPESFEQRIELPALAETAPELMWAAQRLLGALQVWLRARQRGVRALELQWTLDRRRHEGVELPPHQALVVRTSEATQDVVHLRRLMGERLASTTLAAPASWLRLRSLDTAPCVGASASFLPEDNRPGDRLHELVERLSARLGARQVVVPVTRADHRPERMQRWLPALRAPRASATTTALTGGTGDSGAPSAAVLWPAWLLPEPLPLDVRDGHPCYQGRLVRLAGPQRLETGWWSDDDEADADPERGVERNPDAGGSAAPAPALRDYYVARSPGAGLVWVFRERLPGGGVARDARWFLQGLYA